MGEWAIRSSRTSRSFVDEFLMGHYRRNTYVVDQVSRFGQTVGMPLFEQTTPQPDAPGKERLSNAPKVMELATDTQKLSHDVEAAVEQARFADAIALLKHGDQMPRAV